MRLDAEQRTCLGDLFQEGCLKVCLPRPVEKNDVDAVVINTAGGLTGGDALSLCVNLAVGARAAVTTPACERIYRSSGGEAVIEQRISVGSRARLDWVPQETILFEGSRLNRRTDVYLEPEAEITLAEAILFGRVEMGEKLTTGTLLDRWSIWRQRELVFADAVRISDGFSEPLSSPSALRSCVGVASIAHVGSDQEKKLHELRSWAAECTDVVAGATVVNGVLVSRMASATGSALRRGLTQALAFLRGGRPLPRNWLY
jgi:urease accessory protein